MKTIINKYIPFRGYKAMCIFPFLFVRKEYADSIDDTTIRHETIHASQQLECYRVGAAIAVIGMIISFSFLWLLSLPLFYYLYMVDYIRLLIITRSTYKAYKNICFEREAFANQNNVKCERNLFDFFKYIQWKKII